MRKETVSIVLDKRYKSDGKYPIVLRVTFCIIDPKLKRRVRKYYATGYRYDEKKFKNFSAPGVQELRDIKIAVEKLSSNAINIIQRHHGISVQRFESEFFGVASDSVNGQYQNRMDQLNAAGRDGSAQVDHSALESFKKYVGETNDNIRFTDINADWLAAYEGWMLERGRSYNTIAINLRSLRTVFNMAIENGIVPAEMYPFKKFKIKSERKYKLPLSDNELELLKNAERKNPAEAAAVDYWLFSYWCNGMNAVDMLKLRVSDIQGGFLIYDRNKTRNTKVDFRKILIPVGKEIKAIIRRRGSRTLDPNGYLFPFLEKDLPVSTVGHRVKTFIRENNKALKEVAKGLKIKKSLTTVIARHTFANRLMNGGVDRLMIQESLGHQNAETTNHYLGTMDIDKIKKARKAL